MSSDVRKSKTLPRGFTLIVALALMVAPALFHLSRAIAQSDDPAAAQPQDNSNSDSPDPNSVESQTAAAQTAVDDAQTKMDEATQHRDELEAENASQDQIDAANQAIAEARSQKEFAEQALNRLNEAQAAGEGAQSQ